VLPVEVHYRLFGVSDVGAGLYDVVKFELVIVPGVDENFGAPLRNLLGNKVQPILEGLAFKLSENLLDIVLRSGL
jgi:hypothetical protein